MKWSEALRPVTMTRVAVLAPRSALRDVLVRVADEGTVELDEFPSGHPTGDGSATPALSPLPPDVDRWEREGRTDLIAGEAELEWRSSHSVVRDRVAGLTGWMPADQVPHLAARVAGVGGAIVALPRPRGIDPPTQLPPTESSRQFGRLVTTYATVPYADVNPSLLAGLAYVAMFGMMFADVGHGAVLVVVALAARWNWWPRLARLRPVWLFLAGAGLASAVFGAAYGEFFGPTGVIPVIWFAPLDHPVPLLGAAIAVGGVLLGGAYVLGTVNRLREGGWQLALYTPAGLAGGALFLGLGVLSAGAYLGTPWLLLVGSAVVAAGLVLAYIGLFVSAGGHPAGAAQAAIELFDVVIRLGANLVSFARLAAFGLTHAALGLVIWQATTALFDRGVLGAALAIVIFAVGNAVAFALEGLVAGIQALRLEYYELFSRVFDTTGRPFLPWHIPTEQLEEAC